MNLLAKALPSHWSHLSLNPRPYPTCPHMQPVKMLPAGIVDLVGYNIELPPGTQQVFLSLAFICESVLMALHKKHMPLDTMVHQLLFWSMFSNGAAVMLEAIFPRNFLVSCARVGTTFLQCGWFWAATRMMFEREWRAGRAWGRVDSMHAMRCGVGTGRNGMLGLLARPGHFSFVCCIVA